MSYSTWLKTDLHIHSHISKKTKENDYDGCDLTYEKLVEALKREGINLFSITDHNTINIDLYEELIDRRQELIDNKLNFIIGVEIDFMDEKVHDKVFHMLVYFDTYEISKVSKVLIDLYGKENIEEIDKNVPPILLDVFFDSVFNNGIPNVITIPHFNKKDKGIPPKDQIDRFVYTVFNALEDSNNRNNLIKSLKAFKDFNYYDIPIVVFSDNHNIDIYPCGKDGNSSKQTSMHILGNINFPFNSIKSAFQDVRTRISLDKLKMRCTGKNNEYIKAINIDGKPLHLSEYQNTIIGGFGTGKSFLLDMILNGKNNVDREKYSELANKYENFNITFSDGTTRESLKEIEEDVKIIRFNQYKGIYFKNILLKKDIELLENELHIQFPELNTVEEFDEAKLKDSVSLLKANCDQTITVTDIINYDAINRRNEIAYSFKREELENLYKTPDYLEGLIQNLESEIESKILNKDIYSQQEKQSISSAKDIIIEKNSYYMDLSNKMDRIFYTIDEKISNINQAVRQSSVDVSSSIQILEHIKEDLKTYITLLEDLKCKTTEFEGRYSKEKYDQLKDIKEEKELHKYQLIAKYNADEEHYDYKSDILKPNFRDGRLFNGVLRTLNSSGLFTQNQTFSERIDRFTDNYYKNFRVVCYDILENNVSIMKKSAGEKANTIINIIFNIIVEYSLKGMPSIVILDQPEDNLDNKGIQSEVVDRIRDMKINNCLPQLICVTHNANISITADSENIILSKKEDGKCSYMSSGIEDPDFINEVCLTVEGGQEALKRRGAKFNIPIIKELERGI